MEHRWQGARAVLAVVAAKIQLFADFKSHAAEPTHLFVVDLL